MPVKTSLHIHDNFFHLTHLYDAKSWVIKTFSQNEFNKAVFINVIVILSVILLQKREGFNLVEESIFCYFVADYYL